MTFIKNTVSLLITFLLPICSFLIVAFFIGIFPFGDKTLLISDLKNQYTDFFYYFYQAAKGSASLQFSWLAGLGMNFFGIYGYYLGSVFTPLILFLPKNHLVNGISILIMFKIGLSSFTFFLYLSYFQYAPRISKVIFSICYGLMSYLATYFFNIMWLDGVLFLPLVLLGVEYILNGKTIALFVISLTLVLISNFYIAYMVGVFTFLYFVYKLVLHKNHLNHLIGYLTKFILGTLFSLGLASFMLLPTLTALHHTVNKPIPFKEAFQFNLEGLLNNCQIFGKFFIGTFDKVNQQGTANLYVSIFILFLVVLYFSNKLICLREKIITILLVGFLLFSVIFPPLDLLWHGLDLPNWFPTRYSFVISFTFIMLAIRTFSLIDGISIRNILLSYLFLLASCFILLTKVLHLYNKSLILLINFSLLTIYALLFISLIKFKRLHYFIHIVLLFTVFLELTANTYSIFHRLDHQIGFKNNAYVQSYTDVANSLQKHEKDRIEPFDRTVVTPIFSYNDPFKLNTPGINHFSSLMNQNLVQMMNHFGYSTYLDKWSIYSGGTIFSDALFRIKYIYTTGHFNHYGFVKKQTFGHYSLYENKEIFPIGFMSLHTVTDAYKGENPFHFMNRVIQTISPKFKNNQFGKLPYTIISKKNVAVSKNHSKLVIEKKRANKPASVTFLISPIKRNSTLYVYTRNKAFFYTKLFKNNRYVADFPSVYVNNVLPLGTSQKSSLTVSIRLQKPKAVLDNLLFYQMSNQKVDNLVTTVQQNPFVLDTFHETYLKGHIMVTKPGTLVLLVPYDKGWSAVVNGHSKQIKQVYTGLSGIDLQKGRNIVELKYSSPKLKFGIYISLISLLLFIFYLFFQSKGKGVKNKLDEFNRE